MFQNNDSVKVAHKGKILDGRIVGQRTVFYPDSTLNKYGNGSMGRVARGYRVRMPIVMPDGTLYSDRAGNPLMGIGYVEEKSISQA